jgi:hypothetical protein
VRAHFSTILVLLAIAAVAHTGGCVDVTPYPAIDAGSTCDAPLADGGCDVGDAEGGSDAPSSNDGGVE